MPGDMIMSVVNWLSSFITIGGFFLSAGKWVRGRFTQPAGAPPLVTGTVPPATSSSPRDIFDRADALFFAARYQEALAVFEQLRADQTYDQASVAFRMGCIYHKMRLYREADAAFQAAIAHDPHYATAWDNRSMALAELGDYDAALNASTRAVDLRPTSSEAWVTQGVIYMRMRRFREALIAFDHALAISPFFVTALENKLATLRQLHRWGSMFTTGRQLYRAVQHMNRTRRSAFDTR